MRSELQATVDDLYRVFSRYPLVEDVEYCDHCVDPAQVEALHRTPLRHVTAKQLGPLLINSTTWGDQRYFNHFMPRLLELVATGDMNDRSYNIFLPSRLGGLWQSGSDDERRVIGDFAWAWWRETTSTWPSVCEPREVLDTIAECGQEVSPYLDAWPVHVGEPAVRQLAVLVSDLLVSSQQDNGFWCEVNEWLAGPIPADVLAAEVSAAADPDVARDLSDALAHLALWRQSLTASTTERTASSPA